MRKFAIAVSAALGLMSVPVMAADSGFYAGAGLGLSSVETDSIEIVEGESFKFDDSGTGWKIFGGWRMNEYVAFEVDYVDLGTLEDRINVDVDTTTQLTATTEIGLTAWVPYVVGTYPIGMFELSGKLGYAFYDADLDFHVTDGIDSERDRASESDEDFAWGVGVGMTVLENLNVKVEYEAIEVSDADVSVWWLTGAWRF